VRRNSVKRKKDENIQGTLSCDRRGVYNNLILRLLEKIPKKKMREAIKGKIRAYLRSA